MTCRYCKQPLGETKRIYCTKKCKMNFWVREKRRKVKAWAVELAGGCCIGCGYSKCIWALHFHHVRGVKSFEISGMGLTRSREAILEEIKKCDLICSNCHAERHHAECSSFAA